MQGKLAAGETEAALRKVQEIAQILKTLERFPLRAVNPEAVSLNELARICYAERRFDENCGAARLQLDLEMSRSGFERIKSLWTALNTDAQCSLELEADAALIKFKVPHLPAGMQQLKGKQYNSLAQALNLEAGLDLLDPPLIDSLFWAQGCSMQLVCKEGLDLELKFKPLSGNVKSSGAIGR